MSPSSSKIKSGPLGWDKKLLLVFLVLLGFGFIVLNRQANGFLPDARLYPYVITWIGLFFVAFSALRLWQGKEPNEDAQNGKTDDDTEAQVRATYKSTLFYLALFSGFYLAVWLIGFRVAAGLFVFFFMRSFGHSYRWALVYALLGLLMVEGLAFILSLSLPFGLLVDWLV